MIPAALVMVLLTRADGGTVAVTPGQVTSLHAAAKTGVKVANPSARCVVWLADGRVLSVIEPCDVVRKRLEEAK
jgi:uncharacterized cupin superfamily protein